MHLFETPRLLSRHLTLSDTDAMLVIFSNPDVTKWMGDGTTLSRELCKKWVTVSLRNYETKGYGASAVIEKETGKFIGCCGLIHDPEHPEQQEPEIIYAFHPNFWGKGYASELVPAMLRYGLVECKLPCILATIDSENTVSQRIVEKAGMIFLSKEAESDGRFTMIYRTEDNQT